MSHRDIRIRAKEFEVVDVQFDRHNYLRVTVREIVDKNLLRTKITRALSSYQFYSSTGCVPSILPVSWLQGEYYVDSDR